MQSEIVKLNVTCSYNNVHNRRCTSHHVYYHDQQDVYLVVLGCHHLVEYKMKNIMCLELFHLDHHYVTQSRELNRSKSHIRQKHIVTPLYYQIPA